VKEENEMAECCTCGSNGVTLIYACSGSANTGYLADAVSRKLAVNVMGKMTCLAAMGAGLSGFIESAKCAKRNIVIDGCPVSCGKQIFEKLGIPFSHCITTDEGVVKGKTEITPEVIDRVYASINIRIGSEAVPGEKQSATP
jgi:uncharacterized metal-binding protein